MKFIHVSDFHLGKRLHGFSMMEDQKDILNKIIGIIREETPDGVFLAGDVYDKAVPPAEAVRLFDDFLWRLSSLKLPVFVISGNHDSPERISFGSRLLNRSGIHMSPVYDGTVIPVSLEDTLGMQSGPPSPIWSLKKNTGMCLLPISLSREPSVQSRKKFPSAVQIMWTFLFLKLLIMWLWDISTGHRRLETYAIAARP